ncbi:MAG: NF038122 family metalloprotease [Acidocella sp.]|nr:NF038122 family metalloprotease [Acidocella sp.]
MDIKLAYDASTSLAPSGFTTAMAYAASQLDALLTNNITVTISVSWDNSVLGEGGVNSMLGYSYGAVAAALSSHASGTIAQEAAANLAADPAGSGGEVYLTIAQAEALGLAGSVPSSTIEGKVTFGTSGTTLDFNATNRAITGEIDFIGVAEHELTHALARIGWGDGSYYSLMDLYRFASAGVVESGANPATATSPAAYFSIDGGRTDLANFSTTSDYYDWATSVSGDSFDAFASEGVANTLSSVDETLLEAMGFNVACFCPGTRILTPGGEVAVEALAIGDMVTTQAGPRRIKWIGRSAHAGRQIAGNRLALPVTIMPGALGPGAPCRALTVSPGHGVLLHGVLVPAWRLVNGVNVVQAKHVDRVVYLHIELDQHGLLCAEGSWSESYLNETPRDWFQNADEYAALYPGEDIPSPAFLPRIEEGIALQALQYVVNSQAGLPRQTEMAGGLRGELELVTPEFCAGWAQCMAAPEVPVMLLVMAGGEILARLPANRYRADLSARGLGSGCHGFAAALPARAKGAEIMVRRELDGEVLARDEIAAQAA